MLVTHNFRTFKPSVSQTPLCQTIKTKVPETAITSATTNLRRYVWVDSHTQQPNQFELMKANSANTYYREHKQLPENLEKQTPLIDPVLSHILLYTGESDGIKSYLSVAPSPCSGLLHEVACREQENPNVLLSKQQIEVNPDRYSKHGQMVVENKGIIKSFLLPRITPLKTNELTTQKEAYVVLEIDIDQLNVATGLIGVGMPPLTTFGVFVSNYLQKDLQLSGELKFAVGYKAIQTRHRPPHNQDNQNNMRKAHVRACIVISAETDQDTRLVYDKLLNNFTFVGHNILQKKVFFTNKLPVAYWLSSMEAEVKYFLEKNPKKDALDAAFYFSECNITSIPIATGFVLLDAPNEVNHFPEKIYPQAWGETVFRSMKLSLQPFDPSLLFCRKYNEQDRVFEWK